MIAYLPAIYPDELVYSWFCRYYVHSGCLTHKNALQDLFCKRSDTPSKEFIGNLNEEARSVIKKKYSLDELVVKHTMFPLYARFIPLVQKRQALHHIGHDHCDIHHLFSVLPRVDDGQYLRYCPLCVEEDRKRYGEAYWHRKHQFHNASVCIKHGCRLEATEVPVKSEHDYTFHPAEYSVHESDVVYESNQQEKEFALYVKSVFDAPMDFNCDVPVSAILYDGMCRTKYMKPSGRSRYTKMLTDDMHAYYEKMGVTSSASMYQVQRTLLGEQFDFSVVCQIAFFLGISAETLTMPVLTVQQIQKEKSIHYMKANASVDWKMLDEINAPVLERLAQRIYDGSGNIGGRPERVSEKMVYRELGLKGHQLEHMPRCQEIFERYAESYPESWARKIAWAYQKLKEKDEPFYWSDIREMTGVKKSNFMLILQYLHRFMEEEEVKDIILLIGIKNI